MLLIRESVVIETGLLPGSPWDRVEVFISGNSRDMVAFPLLGAQQDPGGLYGEHIIFRD